MDHWRKGERTTRRLAAFLGTASCALASAALAETKTRFQDNPPEFRSAHGLGMGGTGVSFLPGLDAVFVNPAGVAQAKSIVGEAALVSPMVSVGEDGRKLYSDIKSGTDASEMVEKYQGRPQHVGAQNVTGIAFKRAAFGLLESAQVDAYAGTEAISPLPVAEARAIGRAGAYFTTARGFLNDDLLVGITTKVVQKRELALRMSALEVESKLKGRSSKDLLKENLRQGTGAGVDFGVMYRVSGMDTKPSFGVVYRNVGMQYAWAVPKGKQKPAAEKGTLDLGLSLEPGTKRSSTRVALDFTDVTNAYGVSPYKRLHLGAELGFQNIIGAMAGIGQGYPSFGGYLNVKILRIEGGVYGEELGKDPGDLKSRRYFGRVSLGWLQ